MSFKDLVDATILPACMHGDLSEEAVYQPFSDDSSPPDSFTVRGVWSGGYLLIEMRDGIEYSTTRPAFDVRLSDFDEPPKPSDGLTIFDTEYEVIDVQLDGQGAAALILRSA